MRGGIDLGGTKIQAVVVDAEHQVLGQARRPTPDRGRPAGRRRRDGRARCARRPRRPSVEPDRRSPASASARRATSTTTTGTVSERRATCPAGRAPSRSAPRWRGARHAGRARQRRPGRHRRRVPARRRREPYNSLLGVFWGTGVGGGIVLDGKPWLGPRRGRRDRPHGRQARRRACPCGRRGCMEAYAGRARDGGPGAQAHRRGRRRPTCSRSWRSAAATGSPAASGRAR